MHNKICTLNKSNLAYFLNTLSKSYIKWFWYLRESYIKVNLYKNLNSTLLVPSTAVIKLLETLDICMCLFKIPNEIFSLCSENDILNYFLFSVFGITKKFSTGAPRVLPPSPGSCSFSYNQPNLNPHYDLETAKRFSSGTNAVNAVWCTRLFYVYREHFCFKTHFITFCTSFDFFLMFVE